MVRLCDFLLLETRLDHVTLYEVVGAVVKDVGAEGLGFDFLAGQIGHDVANDS